MIVTAYIVAAYNAEGEPALFRLAYGSGQQPGYETVRSAVERGLRRARMRPEEGVVIFPESHPLYRQLAAVVTGPAIALDGISVNEEAFALDLTKHPSFIR